MTNSLCISHEPSGWAAFCVVKMEVGSMTPEQIEYVTRCIADNNVHAFYIWTPWIRLRSEVLDEDRHECQRCKERGKYTKANTVHHVKHVKAHPELALEKCYIDDAGEQRRNLISLCHDCHEREHGYRVKHKRKKPLTEERW